LIFTGKEGSMKTPAGKECRYFFGDYYRGRSREESRLLDSTTPPLPWKPALCETCPVPDILMSNACDHLILQPRLARPFPYIRQQVEVSTACTKTQRSRFDPHIGCGECHPLPPEFINNGLLGGDSLDTDPAD
jgi:hypothetical protein